ncbi:unnamed protein product [Prunus brigantina]
MLNDYGIRQGKMVMFCDNMSAINISKNPVQHSHTKRIYIRHHFIRELVEDNVHSHEFIYTEKQLADIFTKPRDNLQFETLRHSLASSMIVKSYQSCNCLNIFDDLRLGSGTALS